MPETEGKNRREMGFAPLAPGLESASFRAAVTGGGSRWRWPSRGHVWLWLNRQGGGLLWGNEDRFILKPGMYALTGGGVPADWTCLRYPGAHELEVVLIDPAWLAARLRSEMQHADLRGWLDKDCPVAFCGLMGLWEQELFDALSGARHGAGKMIAEAKILEWAAVRLFRVSSPGQAPSFCAGLRNRDPVHRALDKLRAGLDQPLDLARLAREVGIAPHYLSRKVRAETGDTLQRHLRRFRIERACERLSSGRSNVTETALDVGYQSLSHFAKAFREELGVSPREWLARRGRSS